ncbi:MAG: hypothetical protein ACOC2Z_11105 [Coleofasciculus sp.]
MRVTFQKAALDDIRNKKGGVPQQFRKPLREFLRNLVFVGQGMHCTSEKYVDLYFIKFKYWYVMYRAVSEEHIDVVAVQYNYGQLP